ncbi:hypothetical protein J6590_007178 [Homalodisca vitripennis]|nr:hypothetical protein J6590_007178 [Homalodisca vitripennis]
MKGPGPPKAATRSRRIVTYLACRQGQAGSNNITNRHESENWRPQEPAARPTGSAVRVVQRQLHTRVTLSVLQVGALKRGKTGNRKSTLRTRATQATGTTMRVVQRAVKLAKLYLNTRRFILQPSMLLMRISVTDFQDT